MKPVYEMTITELFERRASAKRRMDRYAAMGNEALAGIAFEEFQAVNAELLRRKA